MLEKYSSYIITGPTASGKSEYAHKLAQDINGVIINCDSVQIYRGIENISASPFAGRELSDNIGGIPYRLFSILPLSAQISVANYLDMARREYEAALTAGFKLFRRFRAYFRVSTLQYPWKSPTASERSPRNECRILLTFSL